MSGTLGVVYNLAINQSATGALSPAVDMIQSPFRSFQVVVTTTTGNGNATVNFEGSMDNVNFTSFVTITITSGSCPQNGIATGTYPYKYVRANVTAISGTGALVNAYMSI